MTLKIILLMQDINLQIISHSDLILQLFQWLDYHT